MGEIYALCDPNTETIRYIGKANNSAKRLKSHMRDCRRRKTPVYCWINSLSAKGQIPKLIILEIVTGDWKEREIFHIAQARRNGSKILNVALGGNEPFCSTAIRAANGRNTAKAVHTDPRRKKMWQIKQQLGLALRQGHANESLKAKMRAAAISNPSIFGLWAHI